MQNTKPNFENQPQTVALWYYELGWAVIPLCPPDCSPEKVPHHWQHGEHCQSPGKRPLVAWEGYQKVRASKKKIIDWWSRWSWANIGILTGAVSEIIVLDVDGEAGEKSLLALGDVELTLTVRTGKGWHYYFAYPNKGRRFKNFAKKHPGIDFRGDGGYVVAPPSRHVNGSSYTWEVRPKSRPPVEVPAWLCDLICEQESNCAYDRTDLTLLRQGVAEGKRNESAARLAGHYLAKGLTVGETIALMLKWNQSNKPPLEENELIRVVESIDSREAKKPKDVRKNKTEDDSETLIFDKIEHWQEPVEGQALFDDVQRFVERYVALPVGASVVLTAWVIASWVHKIFDAFPLLALTSPEKQCGKTRCQEVIECLVQRPVRTANLSEAVLFRMIERYNPTLMIDEAQVLSRPNSERGQALHDLLCSANRRGAKVFRCVGARRDEIKGFSVCCPIVISAIGSIGEVLEDRCIVIRMQRRKPNETIERFLQSRAMEESEFLRSRTLRWARDNEETIQSAYESTQPLHFVSDRAAEHWLSLQAVISVACSNRLNDLAEAAKALQGIESSEESTGVKLLRDIKKIFESNDWPEAIPSGELVKKLLEIPDTGWSELGTKGLTPHRLAGILRPYGVHSENSTTSNRQSVRGYWLKQLKPVFDRYLMAGEVSSTLKVSSTHTNIDKPDDTCGTYGSSTGNNTDSRGQRLSSIQASSLDDSAKIEFDDNGRNESGTPDRPNRCYTCRNEDFWLSGNQWICSKCHPNPNLV